MITLASTASGPATVLAVSGRLTMATVADFSAAVERAVAEGPTHVVVDLSETVFVDSSGLGALVAGVRRAREHGGDLRIAGAGEQATAVLSLTNLDKVLLPYRTVEAATDGW